MPSRASLAGSCSTRPEARLSLAETVVAGALRPLGWRHFASNMVNAVGAGLAWFRIPG
jgi:hypothetical protein